MSDDRRTFKRFLLIFAIVFTVACILSRRLIMDSFYVAPGASVLIIPFALFINLMCLATPSFLVAGIIFAVLPEKWGGDG